VLKAILLILYNFSVFSEVTSDTTRKIKDENENKIQAK